MADQLRSIHKVYDIVKQLNYYVKFVLIVTHIVIGYSENMSYILKTKIGMISAIIEGDVITHLSINEVTEGERMPSLLEKELTEYLDGKRSTFSCVLKVQGTDFQKQVWKQISAIPYGETTTYQAIAEKIGRPKAVRAVGSACGKNPIWLIIPCHRVISSSGQLGGYAGGLEMKKWLLKHEAKNLELNKL